MSWLEEIDRAFKKGSFCIINDNMAIRWESETNRYYAKCKDRNNKTVPEYPVDFVVFNTYCLGADFMTREQYNNF